MLERRLPLLLVGACGLLGLGPGAAAPADDPAYSMRLESLARDLEGRPRNAALARVWRIERARVLRDPAASRAALARELDARRLALRRVPGLLYRSHPETGADLRVLGDWLGAPVRLVATNELGTVEENAALLAAELLAASDPPRSVLFSASKGSAEVRTALEGNPALGERVPLWIDLVGVLEGTPLLDVDSGLASETEWLPSEVVLSLSARVRRKAVARSRFPASTRAVHVAAFPEPADVSARARASFDWLRGLGPNDGYVLLDAYLRAPGRVLIERGVDHYLAGATALDEKLLALLHVLLAELEADPPPAR